MTTDWTPGPWEIDTETRPMEICTMHHLSEDDSGGQGWFYIRGELGRWDVSSKEQLANARLIAAAPEMVELLREAATDCGGLIVDTHDAPDRGIGEWLGLVRALLIRIEGPEDAQHDDEQGRRELES